MYDVMLNSIVFRFSNGMAGLFAFAFFGWAMVSTLRRTYSSAAVEEYATARTRGDVDKAASQIRAVFPLNLALVVASMMLIVFAVLGQRVRSFDEQMVISYLVLALFLALWWWLEYEFAQPGILVPKGVRGTPGTREVVRLRRGR